jgi:amidohydrolase/hippurate hydrolase
MSNKIMEEAFGIKDYVAEIKHQIHKNPELSMQEFETTRLVKKELEEMGIEMVPLASELGVLGIIKGTKPGNEGVTALRADMDALPIQEETDVLYASQNDGVMHACGHDCHTAMLLGAAKLLNGKRDEFSGIVKLIFQPAEEGLGGSVHMINLGVLDNPKVDTIVGLHGKGEYPVGSIDLYSGNYMASADTFTSKVIGKGGHGAYPHKFNDTVLAASHVVVGLQGIVSRQIDAIDSAVISVCTINGGKAMNVIPGEVTISGNVRCQSKEVRDRIEGQMKTVIEGIATAYGCTAVLDYHYGIPPLSNDPDVVERARQAAFKIIGEENIIDIETPAMGSEDFAKYLEIIPHGAFIRMGIKEQGKEAPLYHNKSFVFSDEALPYGVAFFTQYVLDNNQ